MEKVGGMFLQQLRGEVHKFPLQKASTAKRIEQGAKRPSWVLQCGKIAFTKVYKALPRLRWGSLQRSPRHPSWWGGDWLPKNPISVVGPSDLELCCLRPFFSLPL